MRTHIVCAAGIALALVLTDQVVATGNDATTAISNVNRLTKADRVPLPRVPVVPAAGILPKTEAAKPPAAKMPEGCESTVSPLAKSATHAPMLCVS